MNVFLTIDTEMWPDATNWPHTPLSPENDCSREFESYFYGGTGAIRTGLQYQLEIFKRHGLNATYFVDPLFSCALGTHHLSGVVGIIKHYAQEIGLHLHPEWLTDPRCRDMPRFRGPYLWQYREEDQRALLRTGLATFEAMGVPRPLAFRAGSWGADEKTLAALKDAGFVYDTSLNPCVSESFPTLRERSSIAQPTNLCGIWEFPVTTFLDRSRVGRRPLQVCACSFDELRNALNRAFDYGWFAVVIVLHSFEFVRVNRLPKGKMATPQRLLAHRFEELCAFLEANVSRFQTMKFADLDPACIPNVEGGAQLSSTLSRTAIRNVQQLASLFY